MHITFVCAAATMQGVLGHMQPRRVTRGGRPNRGEAPVGPSDTAASGNAEWFTPPKRPRGQGRSLESPGGLRWQGRLTLRRFIAWHRGFIPGRGTSSPAPAFIAEDFSVPNQHNFRAGEAGRENGKGGAGEGTLEPNGPGAPSPAPPPHPRMRALKVTSLFS